MQKKSADDCGKYFGFDGPKFGVLTQCTLDQGSYGVESEIGTFEVKGDAFTWTVERSSCSHPAVTGTFTFSLVGDQLRLVGPGQTLVLNRESELNGNVRPTDRSGYFGCFGEDAAGTPKAGDFIPGDIQKL